MSFIVESNQERNFKNVPVGSHLGRCYRIIDLGSQKSEYMGEVKVQRKIMLGWELFGDDDNGQPLTTDDGKPMGIFKNYTLSWSENANLRKDLQAWRGKPWTDSEARRFDLKTILGSFGMLNVVHREVNGKTYANVAGISPVPSIIKTAGLPKAINKNQLFVITEPDMDLFETFGEGLKNKITNTPEWAMQKGKVSAVNSFEEMPDDIPFN
jgi:hypothetical protein